MAKRRDVVPLLCNYADTGGECEDGTFQILDSSRNILDNGFELEKCAFDYLASTVDIDVARKAAK